jgi:hypothetical protein
MIMASKTILDHEFTLILGKAKADLVKRDALLNAVARKSLPCVVSVTCDVRSECVRCEV